MVARRSSRLDVTQVSSSTAEAFFMQHVRPPATKQEMGSRASPLSRDGLWRMTLVSLGLLAGAFNLLRLTGDFYAWHAGLIVALLIVLSRRDSFSVLVGNRTIWVLFALLLYATTSMTWVPSLSTGAVALAQIAVCVASFAVSFCLPIDFTWGLVSGVLSLAAAFWLSYAIRPNPWANPNDLALYLLMCAPLFRPRKPRLGWFILSVAAIHSIAVNSRAGIVLAIASGLIFVGGRTFLAVAAARRASVVGALGFMVATFLRPTAILRLFGLTVDYSAWVRDLLWEASIASIRFFGPGSGLGSYQSVIDVSQAYGTSVHNLGLQVYIDLGLPGYGLLVLFCGFLGSERGNYLAYGVSRLLAVMFFVAASIETSHLLYRPIFWALLGALASQRRALSRG